MPWSRRDFIRLGLSQAALATFPPAGNTAEPERREGLSILQGASDESRTQFSIIHSRDIKLAVSVAAADGRVWFPDKLESWSFGTSLGVVSKAYFSNLYPGEWFSLNIDNSESRQSLDRREFRTLKVDSALRMAICSCMDDRRAKPEIWRDLVAQNPDVILYIGDSVYADKKAGLFEEVDPARLWRRFCESRQTLEIYYSPRLIPILATWDDHDFGGNDVDSRFPYIGESQRNFLTFFAQDPEYCRYLERGPGVSSCLEIGGQKIFLLDDRSYRLPKGSQDPHAHWGQSQDEWMLERISQSTGPVWLMNGSQFFPAMAMKETVSGNHPVQFRELLRQLKALNPRVLFASGDVHYSEISRIEEEALGYETFELTSSSIHSRSVPGAPGNMPNRRRIVATGERNYLLVESQARGFGLEAKVWSHSPGGQINFYRTLSV